VRGFVTALQSKDVAAIAAALNPNEERELVSLVTQAQQTAETGGVTHTGQELAGVDVKIVNVTYDTKNLSDRVARVDITGGKITIPGLDKSKLPLALQGLTLDPGTISVDLGKPLHASYNHDVQPFVMAVKEDRGWFVSPLFTGAELLAQGAGVLGSYPDTLPASKTEKTADEAVKQFLKAITSKDPDAVMARLAPQEQSVARTYDRLWRPYLNDAMNSQAWNTTNLQVSVSKMTDTDLGDGSTGVAIDSLDVAVSNNGESNQFSLENDCVQLGREGKTCLKSFRSIARGDSNNNVAGSAGQQGGSSARATVVAVKTGDGYAVSLLGSAAATGRSALAAFDAKEIFRAFGMQFLLPTGGSLGVGQQLTVDAASTDNVTLKVDKEAKVVLKADPSSESFHLDLRNASGSNEYLESFADGSPGNWYTLRPGQYRITWAGLRSKPGNKMTISATTQ
jgi:limonene-1,2-epoxide hydrolase